MRSYTSGALSEARAEWEARPAIKTTLARGPSMERKEPSATAAAAQARYVEEQRAAELLRLGSRRLMGDTLASSRLEWEKRTAANAATGGTTVARGPSFCRADGNYLAGGGGGGSGGGGGGGGGDPLQVNTTATEVRNSYDIHRRKEMSQQGVAQSKLYHSRIPRGAGTKI
jgi:hypothetical protein